jgi:hypothetical protein
LIGCAQARNRQSGIFAGDQHDPVLGWQLFQKIFQQVQYGAAANTFKSVEN